MSDFGARLAELKKTLSKRPDVDLDFRFVGKPIKKEFEVEYARKNGMPEYLLEILSRVNGMQIGWSFVGWPLDDPDPRALLGGRAVLSRLEDMRFRTYDDRPNCEVMVLSEPPRTSPSYNRPFQRGLLLVRDQDGNLALYYRLDERELDLGDPSTFFEQWIEAGFPHPSFYGTDVWERQRARLAMAPTKNKVVAGARVWPKASNVDGDNGSNLGWVVQLAKATDGKLFAEVRWDNGGQTWIKTSLLAVVADNDLLRSWSERSDASPEDLDGLLPMLATNTRLTQPVMGRDGQQEMTCQEYAWWLSNALSGIPAERRVELVSTWLKSRGSQNVKLEEPVFLITGLVCDPVSAYSTQDAGILLVEGLLLAWLQEHDTPEPEGLLELARRTLGKKAVSKLLAIPRPLQKAYEPAYHARGAELGLLGPVLYRHG